MFIGFTNYEAISMDFFTTSINSWF